MEEKTIAYRFADFEIDLRNRQLKKNGQLIPLNSKYFDVLILLLQNTHQLISKQAIFEQVWQDTIVTDSALSQCIKDIRKALKDDAHHPKFIKTVAKHGYMFIADVTPEYQSDAAVGKEYRNLPLRPYKFLDYYTEGDQLLFFGREHEVETLSSKIINHRSFIIHGRSGVGKSSLIRAGLIPVLKRLGHQSYVIRSFSDPAEEINQILHSYLPKMPANASFSEPKMMLQQLNALRGDRLIIFFFDQFEDFFLQLNKTQKNKFLDYLRGVFQQDRICLRFIFVLREDLLSEMSFFKPAIPELYHHEFRLLKLTIEQAVDAILKPALTVGCPFEESLAQQILEDLSNGENDVDPPQLQIVCDALYDNRHPKKGITLEIYEKLGRASRILEGYMERVLNRFEDEHALMAKRILKFLVSVDFQRKVLPLNELLANLQSSHFSRDQILLLLNELSDARLVRLGRQDGKNWVELSHDFLVPKVREWLTDEELKIRRAQAMLDNAMENFSNHNLLLDEDAIKVLLPFGLQLEPTPEQAYFIAKSMVFRHYILPSWLKSITPNFTSIISEAMDSDDPNIRICALESSLNITDPALKSLLNNAALWDSDLNVRKTASIIFLKNFGAEAQKLLTQGKNHKKAGLIRRAISLSFVRDHNIHLVFLRRLPVFVALLVMSGLFWVRVYRNRKQIVKEISGATLGATVSGLLVGLMLGGILAYLRHTPTFETVTYLLALFSLGSVASFLGGLGISSGLVLMRHISYRHSKWWTVVGGTIGGFIIGAFINIIGIDILKVLFGQQLIKITGAFEAAVLGFWLSLAFVFAEYNVRKRSIKILIVAFGSTIGAGMLTFFKGNLFSGSIAAISRSFTNAQINLNALTSLFGEMDFGFLSRLILGSLEGFLFGGLFMIGFEVFRNHREVKKSKLPISSPSQEHLNESRIT